MVSKNNNNLREEIQRMKHDIYGNEKGQHGLFKEVEKTKGEAQAALKKYDKLNNKLTIMIIVLAMGLAENLGLAKLLGALFK